MKSRLFSRLSGIRKHKAQRERRNAVRRQMAFERLEERQLLSSVPIEKLNPSQYVPNQLLIGFTPDTTPAIRAGILGQSGIAVLRDWNTLHAVLADTSRVSVSLPTLQKQLEAHAKIDSAGANSYVRATALQGVFPDDPYWPEQWAHHNGGQRTSAIFGAPTGATTGVPDADIDAPEAWTISTGASDVVVAVIDTGVLYTHPDLAGNMWKNPGEIAGDGIDNDNNGYVDDVYGIDTANDDTDPIDDHSHGTHVAGTIAAVGDNGLGVAGVSWNAKIMAVKFLTAAGGGTTADAIDAVTYVTMMKRDKGINIVVCNNSWGGGPFDQTLHDAIQEQVDAGIVFTAAAGNNATDNDVTPHYPSSYDVTGIVAVAATDKDDSLATYSHWGLTTVDIAAPGTDILSTYPTPASGATNTNPTGYAVISGTSMATPHVSGALAVIRGLDPALTVDESINLLYSGADPLPSLYRRVATNARLNLYSSLNLMTPAEVRGTVWNDVDKDARLELNETGLAGWTVFMDLDMDGLQDRGESSTLTAADGTYRLLNFRGPGTYNVRVVKQAQYTQTYPAGTVPVQTVTFAQRDSVVQDINFGFYGAPGKVTGYKWDDADGDRIKDLTEKGLAGWIIYADLNKDGRVGVGEPKITTNSIGYYELANIPAGVVHIREVQQVGWVQTYPADPYYHELNLGPSQTIQNVNFGNNSSQASDFGDAPAPYPTLLKNNGARAAILTGFWLGPSLANDGVGIDGEVDGFQTSDPTVSDDNTTTGVDDEDGVAFETDMAPGKSATVEVTVTLGDNAPAMLQGWVDFNGDGDWSDTGEQIFLNKPLVEGTHTLSFAVPPTARPGTTWARFRYGYEKNLLPTGASYVGEVEDYRVTILSDRPLAVEDNFTVLQDSSDNVLDVLLNDVPSVSGRSQLAIMSWTQPASGTVAIDRNNTPNDYTDDRLLYTPDTGFYTIPPVYDTFFYTISDLATGATSSAAVKMTVTQTQGTVPLAVDDSYTLSVATDLDVLANDRSGPTGVIRINSVTPANARWQIVTRTVGGVSKQYVNYTPLAGFVGAEQFEYGILDGNNVASTATVTVHTPQDYNSDDVVKFHVELTDMTGTALPKNTLGQYEIGQGLQFQVNILVDDLRGEVGHPALPAGVTAGVFSAYMDLLYDAGLVLFDSATPDGEYPNWNIDSSVPGILNETGSFQALPATPVGPNKHLLFSAVFTAANRGLAAFKTDPADRIPLHETSFNDPAATIDYQQIEFGHALLNITEAPDLVKIRLAVTDTLGRPLVNNQLVGGQEFIVQAWVSDLRTVLNPGVFSAYLDIFYTSAFATYKPDLTNRLLMDITFGSLFGGSVKTPPEAHNGQKGDPGVLGLINEVGAFQGGSAMPFSGEQLLCEIRFLAVAPPVGTVGTLLIEANPADDLPFDETTVINPPLSVPTTQIAYVNPTPITVVRTGAGGEGEFTNPTNRFDVNGDGLVSPVDCLLEINFLNLHGPVNLKAYAPRGLAAGGEGGASTALYLDTNGDYMISAADVLCVVNYLNLKAIGGEGEETAAAGVTVAVAAPAPLVAAAVAPAAGPTVTAAGNPSQDLPRSSPASGTGASAVGLTSSNAAAVDPILTDDLVSDILAGWKSPAEELSSF